MRAFSRTAAVGGASRSMVRGIGSETWRGDDWKRVVAVFTLAGLLMWVPSGLVFIVFGLALFAAWLGESDKRVALGRLGGRRTPRALLAPGGHDDAA